MTSGRPVAAAKSLTASIDSHTRETGTGSPISSSICLKACRSSALRIVSIVAPSMRTSPGHGPRHRRPAAHHIDEPVVQVLVVLRPRAAFGVVLDAEHRQRAVTEAFDRSIVQVALRDVEVAGGDRGRIDLELVVLAGDVHTARVEVLDRMVGAVVAVRKTRGGCARGAPENLVAEADAEDREVAERLPRQLDRAVQHRRVAGTVR